MLLKSRASPEMLLFNLCNKKKLAIRHMNRPLFNENFLIFFNVFHPEVFNTYINIQ